jgi:TRAP-type C4-dicarboxylate transport system permease large subunit
VPQTVSAALIAFTSNIYAVFAIIVFILVIAGMFIETGIVAMLLTPVFLPVVKNLGVDPVHFGIVMMTVVTFGIMTPPVGVALYATSEIMGCTPEETVKEALPFYFALGILVLVLILFPQITLYLPNLVYGIPLL